MFIDTSAILALVTAEPEAEDLTARLDRAEHRRTSPLVRLEACAFLGDRARHLARSGRKPV